MIKIVKLSPFIADKTSALEKDQKHSENYLDNLHAHVIIAGFGLNGSNLARVLKETGINFETGAAFFGVGRFAGGRAANGFTALALMMAVYVKSSTPITSPSDSSSVFREGELIFERWVT